MPTGWLRLFFMMGEWRSPGLSMTRFRWLSSISSRSSSTSFLMAAMGSEIVGGVCGRIRRVRNCAPTDFCFIPCSSTTCSKRSSSSLKNANGSLVDRFGMSFILGSKMHLGWTVLHTKNDQLLKM